MQQNYYSILEVSKRNSAFEIRQSYKKVSLKLHPDKNPSLDAEEKFQELKSAYDVRIMPTFTRNVYLTLLVYSGTNGRDKTGYL